MKTQLLPRSPLTQLVVAAAVFFAGLASPVVSRAVATVDAGWDLFESQAGTSFQGTDFKGVSLGDFNFGGAIGVQNAGNTDTIIQRTYAVSGPGTQTVNLQMVAMQLVTVAPANLFGGGVQNYYITLQTNQASTGTMMIDFDTHTFTSSLDVFFDVRAGSLTGNIVDSGNLLLTSSATPWSNVVPPGSVLINGVNHDLNGIDTSNDFWPTSISQTGGGFTQAAIDSVPDGGGTAGLLAAALLGLGVWRWTFERQFGGQTCRVRI